MQVDALVFQCPPQLFNEDIVEVTSLAVHRDASAGAAQAIGPGERGELAALIGVRDPGRAEAVDRLVQRLDAEIGLPRHGPRTGGGPWLDVRDAPGRNLSGVPIHDGNQIGVQSRQLVDRI